MEGSESANAMSSGDNGDFDRRRDRGHMVEEVEGAARVEEGR